MVKVFLFLVITWLFVACSGGPDDFTVEDQKMPGFVDLNINLAYNNGTIVWPMEGFQAADNYPYGFDYIPNDKIVHVSIPYYYSEDMFVYTNIMYGTNYDYYLCSNSTDGSLSFSEDIPEEEEKYKYIIDSYTGNISLCKEDKNDGVFKLKIQELYVHSYEEKQYDFQIYILGNPNETRPTVENQLLNSNDFWNGMFNKYYRQALITHGSVDAEIVPAGTRKIKWSIDDDDWNVVETQKDYVLTKAREIVPLDYNRCSNKGEIGNAINTIDNNARYWEPKRGIIQIGYKTKRFWPLNFGYNSDICGTYGYNDDPKVNRSIELELEPLPEAGPECLSKIAEADVSWNGTNWMLKFKDGSGTYPSTEYNADPMCVVFAEKKTNSLGGYIGEISERPTLAETNFNEASTIIILPLIENRLKTTRVALHELGHAMGLFDISDDIGKDNLMHYLDTQTDYKLRKRPMTATTTGSFSVINRTESQWDCLQKINESLNCANSTLDKWNIEE